MEMDGYKIWMSYNYPIYIKDPNRYMLPPTRKPHYDIYSEEELEAMKKMFEYLLPPKKESWWDRLIKKFKKLFE